MPYGIGVDEAISWRKDKMGFDSKYGAMYYPWVRINGELIPPSGLVAGSTRGWITCAGCIRPRQ